MRTPSNPQPATAALRIGGAAALGLAAMLGISALVGGTATDQGLRTGAESSDVVQSRSAAALPGLDGAGNRP